MSGDGLDSALDILAVLIGFDTTSRNSNLDLIAWVRAYLDRHGVAYDVIPSADGTKANMFASIGPPVAGGIVLSGHTDVVPVDGQHWTSDPFVLTRRGSRLFGRGTSDMKGYVACLLAMVPAFQAAALRAPIHLALSYDEEVGCLGARDLVAHMQARGMAPAAVFVGEPSEMGVVDAHKGSRGLLTRLVGQSCHSSRPDLGTNAVLHAGTILTAIAEQAAALAAAPDSVGVFEPPHATTSVGVVRGGTVRNTVAGDCEIEWDIRGTLPGTADRVADAIAAVIETRVLPPMRAGFAGAEAVTRTVYDVPPLIRRADNEAADLARRLTGRNDVASVPYGSEAGMFQAAGYPTVICGPGDIAQAHTPDEFIAISELENCLAFLARLAERAGAP